MCIKKVKHWLVHYDVVNYFLQKTKNFKDKLTVESICLQTNTLLILDD